MKMINLKGVGDCKAIEAGSLESGMAVIWNYGEQSEVVEVIASKTGKTITASLRSMHDGIIRSRKMSATRLVAIA